MTNEQKLREALEFYADPANYHAIGFRFDRPCGGFADDFSKDHGDEFYDRPMPGKLARETLKSLQQPTSDEGTPTETPLTDALCISFGPSGDSEESKREKLVKHSRTLERTLHAKERELEEAKRQLAFVSAFADPPDMATGKTVRSVLEQELDEAKQQLATLQSASAAPQYEHDWECVSPGLYESLYQCRRCPAKHMARVEEPGPYLPTSGCVAPQEGKADVGSKQDLLKLADSWLAEWQRCKENNYYDPSAGLEPLIQFARDCLTPPAATAPIPMILYCPGCGRQHIDESQPEKNWDNPPHRSHECQFCGTVWRPADVPTTGVLRIETKGKRDTARLDSRCAATDGFVMVPREPTDEWAERFCHNVNWHPDGAENKFVEGRLHTVSFRDLAKGYIRAMLAAAPQSGKKEDGWISVSERLPEMRHVDDQLVKFEGRIIPAMHASDRVHVFLEDDHYMDRLVQISGYTEPVWETYGDRVTFWRPKIPNPSSPPSKAEGE